MKENTFARNVFTLMMGAGASQIITFILAPIVTRIFSPEDFSTLEHYTLILGILSVFSTFKMELAIVQAESSSKALSIVKWCVRTGWIVLGISSLAVVVFNSQVTDWFKNEELGLFLYLIPFNLLLVGFFQLLVYWNHRHKNYKSTSTSKVLFNGTNELSKISLGSIGLKPGGLIVSNFLARLCAVLFLLRRDKSILDYRSKSYENAKVATAEYSDFYKYSVWGSLLGKFATWSHIIMFSNFFGLWSIGFFALSRRLILSPLSVFSQSFAQVFYQEISSGIDHIHIKKLFFKFLFRLGALSVLMIVTVLLIPNGFYSWTLGEEWSVLGDFMRLLIFWFALNFMTSSLSFVSYRLGKQKQMLWLDALHFSLVVGSVLIGYYGGFSEWETLQFFVIGKVTFFVINIIAMIFFVLNSVSVKINE